LVYDPTDPVGRLLFNVLAMVAEFESDLIRLRTREGMKVAKAKGRLRGKQPKLNHRQEAHLVALLHGGEYSTAELADLFGVARSTVYRAVERERVRAGVGVGSNVVCVGANQISARRTSSGGTSWIPAQQPGAHHVPGRDSLPLSGVHLASVDEGRV
jgi:hypothetical protein